MSGDVCRQQLLVPAKEPAAVIVPQQLRAFCGQPIPDDSGAVKRVRNVASAQMGFSDDWYQSANLRWARSAPRVS
jgi:hypothetical protein